MENDKIKRLLSLSSNPEALLASLIEKTLAEGPPEPPAATAKVEIPVTVVESPNTAKTATLNTPFNLTEIFQEGARFRKRTKIAGRERIIVTVVRVEGINVWFDKDFRAKAWVRSSTRKKVTNAESARLFLQEFERI